MTPTYSVKGGLRYRYYVSRAMVEMRKSEAGTVPRVSAEEVEAKVIEALRSVIDRHEQDSEGPVILAMASRIVIERGRIAIELTAESAAILGQPQLHVPWSPKPGKAKRNIILPHVDPSKDQRPIQAERRSALLRSVSKGRFWLKELSAGHIQDVETIAAREGRSKRSVQMMISLAFVAPDIIEAAVAGALPRGIGLTRLMDLPPLWAEQRQALGLKA
jgi:site-specific DNA recombinase